jgi:hypothetical protein
MQHHRPCPSVPPRVFVTARRRRKLLERELSRVMMVVSSAGGAPSTYASRAVQQQWQGAAHVATRCCPTCLTGESVFQCCAVPRGRYVITWAAGDVQQRGESPPKLFKSLLQSRTNGRGSELGTSADRRHRQTMSQGSLKTIRSVTSQQSAAVVTWSDLVPRSTWAGPYLHSPIRLHGVART